MRIELTYPHVDKRRSIGKKFVNAIRWLLLFGAYICVVINIAVGGKAWSLIALMAIYMFFALVLSPDLVEYNRISQFIKLIVCACILLILINVFLSPGWAVEVVPIVCFAGLAVSALLFFTDLERQRQNMLPMLLLIFIAIFSSAVGLLLWHEESRWALAVMGAFGLALLVICAVMLGSDFLRELKCRFHTK